MNLLLDTHALLWALSADHRLRPKARDAVIDPDNLVLVSAASVWEVAIKTALGKLEAPADLLDEMAEAEFDELSISGLHGVTAGALPLHHRDPFDRMLIAQARLESLTIVTADPVFERYGVSVLHASA